MPVASNPPSSHIRCAEAIALSALLSTIPSPPSRSKDRHHIHAPVPITHDRIPLGTEHKLARTLAFFAHCRHDPDHIPAVCLHLDSDTTDLRVLFAVNKVSYTDGEAALNRIEQGFQSIFSSLAMVSNGQRHGTAGGVVERKVFEAIIVMCAPRILHRLGLSSSGGKYSKKQRQKQPLRDILQQAIVGVQRIAQSRIHQRDLRSTADQFKASARDVTKLLDAWLRYRDDSRLQQVINGVHSLQKIDQLSELIHAIRNRDLDPCLRASLLNIIAKVSRYREAARFLYRTAKKVPAARRMKAMRVQLPREAFKRPVIPDGYVPCLSSKLTNPAPGPGPDPVPKRHQSKLLKELCNILNLAPQEASETYSKQITRTLTESKVHAEAQLLAYCAFAEPEPEP